MKLKFIGKDGSLGLRHGQDYLVVVSSTGEHIVLHIMKDKSGIFCPYSSPQTFAQNWTSAKE